MYQLGWIRLVAYQEVKAIFPINFMDLGAFSRLSRRHALPLFRAVFLCLALAPAAFSEALPERPGLEKEINHPDGSLKEKYGYYLDAGNREVREGLNQEFYPDGVKNGEIRSEE